MNAQTLLLLTLIAIPIIAYSQDQSKNGSPIVTTESELAVLGQLTLAPAEVIDLTDDPENDLAISKILADLPVSVAQANTQQTPIDNRNGVVYIANIEPGPHGDIDGINLRTVVRKGTLIEEQDWLWESSVIEDRTIHDQWHTAPSIATDKDGFVHIAYNMHNLPWQYKVSDEPDSIEGFEFRGEKIKQSELENLHFDNQVNFSTLGKADIPGNLITYPAFFKDRQNDLYVTYRFAARPKRPHTERTFSSGIAKYDSKKKSWNSIGSEIDVTRKDRSRSFWAPSVSVAFASSLGWTSYRPYLVFDSSNRMHANWYWRKGTSGALVTRPCYLVSENQIDFYDADGKQYTLPVNPENCGNTATSATKEFYNIGNTAINSKNDVYMVRSPNEEKRQLLHYDTNASQWSAEESPYSASELFFDSNDNAWAIGSGLKILRKKAGETFWTLLYANQNKADCLPRVSQNADKTIAYIHTQSCESYDSISVYSITTN